MADKSVKLSLDVTTSGVEEIRKLADDVRALAKEGGDAAPELKQLADELASIADTKAGVDALSALKQEVNGLSAAQKGAAATTNEIKTILSQASAETTKYAEKEKEAKAAVETARTTLAEKRDALALLKLTTDDAGKSEVEYKQKVSDLSKEIIDAKAALRERRAELSAASAQTSEAKVVESELASEFSRTAAELKSADAALNKKNKSLESLSTQLKASGVDVQNLGVAETKLKDDLTQATAQIEKQVAALSAAGKSKALDELFSTTGVRSAQAIRAEIEKIEQSLLALQTDSRVTKEEFDRAFTSAKERVAALNNELKGTQPNMEKTGQNLGMVKAALSQLAATYGAFEMSKAFIDANVQLETLRRSLTIITGSTKEAERQIAMLKDVASRSGQSFGELTQEFIRFTAATRTAGLESKITEGVFASVTAASGKLGLSTQQTGLILTALGQIASKGKVQLEELQGQLGESLPGALKLTADGLGITTAQLVKLTGEGKLMADDFFPAFQKGLEKAFGSAEEKVTGFQATWNNLKNTMTDVSQFLGATGIMQALGGALTALGVAAYPVVALLGLLAEGFFALVKAIAYFVGAITTGNWKQAFTMIGEDLRAIDEHQTKLLQTFAKFAGVSDETVKSLDRSSKAAQSAGKTTEQAKAGLEEGAKGYTSVSFSADAATLAQARAGQAATAASAAATGATPGWTALTVAYQDTAAKLEVQVKAAEKNVESKKAEGQALEALAKLTGNEVAQRNIAVLAAEEQAKAAENLAAKKADEVAAMTSLVAGYEAEKASSGTLSKAKQEELDKTVELLGRKKAEAEAARNAAEVVKLEVASRQAAVTSYEDNSAQLATLAKAYVDSKTEEQALIEAIRSGQVTYADASTRLIELAKQENKYRDAVNDTIAAIDRKKRAQDANAALGDADIKVSMEQAKAEEVFAKAIGNTRLEIDAKVRQKQLEIEQIERSAAAKLRDIQATIDEANVTRNAKKATDEWTPAMEENYQILLKSSEAKRREVDATKVKITSIRDEIDALYRNGLTQKQVSDSNISNIEREIAELEKKRALQERIDAEERKRKGVDINGFSTDKAGNTIVAGGELTSRLGIMNFLKQSGVTEQEARRISGEFVDSQGNVPYFSNPGQLRYGGQNSTISQALLKAAEKSIFAQNEAPSRSTATTQQTQQAPATTTVNINLNGSTTPIQVASQADANALANLLGQLQNASNRSTV